MYQHFSFVRYCIFVTSFVDFFFPPHFVIVGLRWQNVSLHEKELEKYMHFIPQSLPPNINFVEKSFFHLFKHRERGHNIRCLRGTHRQSKQLHVILGILIAATKHHSNVIKVERRGRKTAVEACERNRNE